MPKTNAKRAVKEKPVENTVDQISTHSFRIAGIGASAGGLGALTAFLKALPPRTGLSFVLVQHLDPKHESALTQLLSRATSMPVLEVTEGIAVEPDHVYVIPHPNKSMLIRGGVLQAHPSRAHCTPRTTPSTNSSPRLRRTSPAEPSASFFPVAARTARSA